MTNNAIIIADNSRGIYAAQYIAQNYNVYELTQDALNALNSGPEHPDYWDAVEDLINNGEIRLSDGSLCVIHVGDSGDFFALPVNPETGEVNWPNS